MNIVNSHFDFKKVFEALSLLNKTTFLIIFLLLSPYADCQTLHALHDSTSTRYGFKNKTGKVVVEPQFIFALEPHCRNLLFGVTDSGLIAINTKGEFLFKAYPFDNGPDYFSNGLTRVVRDNRIGYANKEGKIVVPPTFLYAEPFNNGRAKVSQVERHTQHDPKICNHYHETYDFVNKRGRIVWDRHDKHNLLRETPKK